MSQTSSLAFQGTHFDAIDRNGQPWLRLPQIGAALGYARPHKIQQVFERNTAEFTSGMTAVIKLPTAGGVQDVRIFSLRGAHLLGMFARTAKAAEFRRWVLDILEREANVAQPHTITAAQQQHLKELVDLVAESGRQTHGETWARLHRKFGIPRYVELPAARFDEACQYLKGKLDEPSIAALVQKHLPQAVPAPTLQGRRWLVSVGRSGRETAMPVPEEAVLLAVDEIAAWLGEPGVLLHSGQLAAIACACIQRMAQRLPAAPGSRAAAPAFPSLV